MKTPRRAVTGVLLLDKHAGLSSNSAVGWAKRLFNADKAGHTGTLDPFATGLLPICFGEASKFSRFMLDADKGYRATLKLGEKSSTGDTEGEIVERRAVQVDAAQVEAVLRQFLGARTQVPPMHSALKRDGVPLYKLARQGIEVERAPRDIVVGGLSLIELAGDVLVLDTLVSKGTYIRVLAEDIGAALGCGAHLTDLRRTATGGFAVDRALSLEALESMAAAERDSVLLAPDSLAQALAEIRLDPVAALALQNGQTPRVSLALAEGREYRAYITDATDATGGDFLGIAVASAVEAGTATLTAMRLMAPPKAVAGSPD